MVKRLRSIGSRLANATSAAPLLIALLAGCRKDAPTPEKPAAPAPVPASSSASAPPTSTAPAPAGGSTRVVRVTLASLRAAVTLPAGWDVLASQSDESAGLVAFGPSNDNGASVFLDGTVTTRVPASAPLATRESLAHDACAKPAVCTALATETLPGGFLVSVRMPKSVFVESWRAFAPTRAVRCGFEAAPAGSGAWLDDAAAVARARKLGEEICRSVSTDEGP